MLRSQRASGGGFLASLGRAGLCVLGAFALAACGSKRLDTAFEPLGDLGGSAGSGGAGAAAGAALSGGSAGANAGGKGGDLSGADAGAGGELAPLNTVPLVTFADFGDSSMVGPLDSEHIQVSGQIFTDAWRATMSEPPSTPWVAQLVVPLNKPVQANQLLHVSFWLTCEAPRAEGDCYTEYIFERASDPWEKSVTFPEHAENAWSQKSEYFSVVNSYDAGAAHMVFRLGYAAQVIVIGGLQVEAIEARP